MPFRFESRIVDDPRAQRNFEQLEPLVLSRVSQLPSKGTDGQLIVYEADPAAGVLWTFRYNAKSGLLYKWEFVGGSALSAEGAGGSTTSTTYANAGTMVAVTAPLAGVYDVELEGQGYHNGAMGAATAFLSYTIGASAAADADALTSSLGNAAPPSGRRTQRKTIATAGALATRIRVNAAVTGTWGPIRLAIRPVIVG